jgi:predicted CXXCH cytochrome family protein
MSAMNLRRGLGVAAILVCALVPLGGRARAEDGCVTEKCHPTVLTGSTSHAVAETCDSCHTSTETPHPQKGKKTFKLSEEEPDLCYGCHDKFGEKKTIHSPVEQGMCTSCHNPHSSNQEHLLTDPPKELCVGCHEDHTKAKEPHGPVSAGDCLACHEPHETDTKALLKKEDDELCFGCHKDMAEVPNKPFVHTALSGGCTSCHNPHGTDHRKLLSADGRDACFECHTELGDTVKGAVSRHKPVDSEKTCMSCHSPHASDNENQLLKPQKELCLSCHDKILPKDAKVLHKPIAEGKCATCHGPHGSPNRKLLIGEFSTELYVPYTDTEYSLCFSCHKRDLVQYPETSFATNFRDGEKNLHYLHVNKEKGRSCRFCHSLHAGNNAKLINDTVQFGQWSLPLNYVKTDTGGGCAPGCHKPQSYDRETPGKKPPAPKPAPKQGGA